MIITIVSFIGCICVKKTAIRTLFVIVGVFCGLMATLIGSFTYATKYRINPVDSSVSPDGKYELLFQQIGDPEWPFGSTHARLVLRDESGIITKDVMFRIFSHSLYLHTLSLIQYNFFPGRMQLL